VDNKILAGLVLSFVLVVTISGVLIFNPFNSKIPLDSGKVGTVNQTMENNTTNTTNNFFYLSNSVLNLLPFSMSHNGQSAPTSGPTPTPNPGPTPDSMDHIIHLFDAYITSNYNQSLIPGMAVVIIQNGKIIYMNPLGVKDLASGEPVDENTLFGIASISKQFTSTNIAQLVDKGLMGWEDPIAKYYQAPDEFLLYDDLYVSNNITIRDVLMHNSGLSRELGNEYPTYFNDSFDEAIFNLRYVKNATSFRSTYAYNSLVYALGGYCAAQANNTTWNELINEKLLDPLGMTTTTTSYWDFLNSLNHATPYKLLKNGTMVSYDIIPDPVGPAGSIYSSISEMANWLKFQTADTGYYNGVQIVSKEELDETRNPQINVTDPLDLAMYGSKYGLGWFIQPENKDLPYYISHPGDSTDFHAQITIYPSQNLGIVILTNGGVYATNFRSVLDSKFRQLLIGNENFDPWPATKNAVDAAWKPESPTPPLLGPTLNLDGYAGVYFNMIYGKVTITSSNNKLICNYGTNEQAFNLEHFNGDVFNEPYNDFSFNFTDISNDKANKLTVSLPDYTTYPSNSTTVFNRTNST
jgi:CubicO group peptidase (beta-lactamase class C family)